jgi:hypothetical protein
VYSLGWSGDAQTSRPVIDPTCIEPMSPFSQGQLPPSLAASAKELMKRTPRRISATFNWQTAQRLQERADLEGRSVSNLVAFLVENAM